MNRLAPLLLLLSVAARAEEAVDEETRQLRAKWKAVGVEDPYQVEMMRIWEKQPAVAEDLEEWAIGYSPGRKYAVVYRYYEKTFVRSGPTTLTWFRVDKDRPTFLRHDVIPTMAHYEVNDDGVTCVMTFNYNSAIWHLQTLEGKSWEGMCFALLGGLKAQADGSFTLAGHVADYKIALKDGKPTFEIAAFHDDAPFNPGTYCEPEPFLPSGISQELALDYAKNLEALARKADEVWEQKRLNPAAWLVRTYVKEVVPMLRDPAKPYEKDGAEVPLPLVKNVLHNILKRRETPDGK